MDGDIPTLRTTCQCHIAHHIGYALGIKGPSRSLRGERWGPRSTSAGKQASDKTCPSVQVEKANPIVIAEEPEQCAMQPCVNSRIKLTRTWFSHTSSIPCSKSHSPYLFSWDPNPLTRLQHASCSLGLSEDGSIRVSIYDNSRCWQLGKIHNSRIVSHTCSHAQTPTRCPKVLGPLRISRQSTIVRISRDNGNWEETRGGPASLGPRNRSAVPGRSKLPTIIRSWQIDIRSGRHPDSLVSVDDFHLAILDAMLASSPTYIKYRRMQGQINVSHCFSTALCHHINIEDSAFQSIHVFA
jgi:hypothetical protein